MSEPLQTALAAEHAAVYLYGTLGGRTSRTASAALYGLLRAAYEHHRSRRDQLAGLITDAGATPTPAAAAYRVPASIDSAAGVRRAAVSIERSCARTYAYVVAETAGAHRAWAIGALADAAVRELSFGGTPATLPGVDG